MDTRSGPPGGQGRKLNAGQLREPMGARFQGGNGWAAQVSVKFPAMGFSMMDWPRCGLQRFE
jgi:hypothetical protein